MSDSAYYLRSLRPTGGLVLPASLHYLPHDVGDWFAIPGVQMLGPFALYHRSVNLKWSPVVERKADVELNEGA